jgi:hypothetical protein
VYSHDVKKFTPLLLGLVLVFSGYMIVDRSGGIGTFLPWIMPDTLSHDRVYFSMGYASMFLVAVLGILQAVKMLRLTKYTSAVDVIAVLGLVEILLMLPALLPGNALFGMFSIMTHQMTTPVAIVALGLLITGIEGATLRKTLMTLFALLAAGFIVKHQIRAPSILPRHGPSLEEEYRSHEGLRLRDPRGRRFRFRLRVPRNRPALLVSHDLTDQGSKPSIPRSSTRTSFRSARKRSLCIIRAASTVPSIRPASTSDGK